MAAFSAFSIETSFKLIPMAEDLYLAHRGQLRCFQPVADSVYLNIPQYLGASESLGRHFAKYSHNVICVSYSFARDLFLRSESQYPGLFIQPVIEKSLPATISLAMPASQYSVLPKERFISNIKKLQAEMAAGSFYLLNYTENIDLQLDETAMVATSDLAEAFVNIRLPDRELVYLSPETFLNIDGLNISTLPIKGTSQAGQAKDELLLNTKEHAEQTMVVDLLRNDLGEICQPGSVHVPRFKEVIKHHGLWQMFSTIQGKLKRPFTLPADLLKLLPAGSISGMPKHEVLKALALVEPADRSFYTGVAGFYDAENQAGFFNILIRGLEIKGRGATLGVGSGITIESRPGSEYEECVLKANSVIGRFSLMKQESP